MNRCSLTLVAGILVTTALAYEAVGEGENAPLMVSFTDLKWTEVPGTKGMLIAIVSGDPRMGPYTWVRKVPPGTDLPVHAHSSELTNVIIKGLWYTGVDVTSAKDFGPGSVVMMPAHWVHVSGCRAGSECVFYQDGKGLFDFKPMTPPAPAR
jgi:hypothetical protein